MVEPPVASELLSLQWTSNPSRLRAPQLLMGDSPTPRQGHNVVTQLSDIHAESAVVFDGVLAIADNGPDPHLTLTFENALSGGHVSVMVDAKPAKLYRPALYLNFGDGFSEGNRLAPVLISDGRIYFAVPDAAGLCAVRFDPTEAVCDISIRSIAVTNFPLAEEGPELSGVSIQSLQNMQWDAATSSFRMLGGHGIMSLRLDQALGSAPLVLLEAHVVDVDGMAAPQHLVLGKGNGRVVQGRDIGDGRCIYALSMPGHLGRIALQIVAESADVEVRSIAARVPVDRETWPALQPSPRRFWEGNGNRAINDTVRANEDASAGPIIDDVPAHGPIMRILSHDGGRITGLVSNWKQGVAPAVEVTFIDHVVERGSSHLLQVGHPLYDGTVAFGFDIHLAASSAPAGAMLGLRVADYEGRQVSHYVPFDPAPAIRAISPIDARTADLLRDIEFRLTQPLPATSLSGPLVSILTPVYNVADVWLRRMTESVCRQTYGNWELCLVDDGSPDERVRVLLRELAASDPRIKVQMRERNGGIAAATNDALAMASGEFIALLDNDDMLTCDALEAMIGAVNDNVDADWLYSDECRIDEEEKASSIFAKPDWSPLMLMNYMYTGHFSLYRRDLVIAVGGFRSEFDFSQDYDLALRLAEATDRVVHVEKVLYGWRMIEGSSAADGKPEARISNIAALQSAVDRRGWNGTALALPTANRVKRDMPIDGARVSIVIPSDNEINIATSIRSILDHSSYRNYEIIVVTNSRIVAALEREFPDERVKWSRYDAVFNFSGKCNAGAAVADGDYVVFFNDDVRVMTDDWMEAILEVLTLPGVGAVGPKLLYEDGLIQHAGMVTGVRRLVGTAFHTYPSDTSAHFNMAQCVREVSLICGALLAMPMGLFRDIGGYDAVNAPINHSDVDLCFRVREAGYSCVYTPYATLTHIGHVSLAADDAIAKETKLHKKNKADPMMLGRFGSMVSRDPYFTATMRDLIYIDSQETFTCFPGDRSDAKKDVFIISHDLTRSGAPKVVIDMASVLKGQGYMVTVAAPFDGPYRSDLQAMGITVIIDPLILTAHDASVDLARNYDVVIVNTIVGWRCVRALHESTDVHWYTHETELVDEYAEHHPGFEDLLGENLSIWSGSEKSAQYLRHYGASPNIMEYGADDIRIDSIARSVRIAVFGTFEPRKGQDLAVLAHALLPDELRARSRLMLFGRTNNEGYRQSVRGLVAKDQAVEFHGELTYQQYREELEVADVVFIPSRDDTLPLVSLDALAMSKPLVMAKSTGTSKYLIDGKSALVTEHPTPVELAQKLAMFIVDESFRKRVGKAGREVFEKQFTRDAFQQRLIGAIEGGFVGARDRS